MKNLISISGRIGHGKDLIASIIQYLIYLKRCKELKIKKCTLKEFQGSTLEMLSLYSNKKMAGKLKQIASILTGIPVNKFEDQEFKKTNLGPEWGYMTVREFLQRIGTEAIRNGLHKDTWLNAFWIDYHNENKWIITDCRFENEYNSIKERGGLMIKVERPGIETQNHASETGLDMITDWDYVIKNDSTIDNLIEKVQEILIKEKII